MEIFIKGFPPNKEKTVTFHPKANWSRPEAAGKTEEIRKNQYLIIKSVKLTVKKIKITALI